MEDEERPCPLCNSATDWKLECPGTRGMVCVPPCGNAIEWTCTSKDCQWWYREPNNRRDRATMGIAPTWLAEALREFEEDDEDDG